MLSSFRRQGTAENDKLGPSSFLWPGTESEGEEVAGEEEPGGSGPVELLQADVKKWNETWGQVSSFSSGVQKYELPGWMKQFTFVGINKSVVFISFVKF